MRDERFTLASDGDAAADEDDWHINSNPSSMGGTTEKMLRGYGLMDEVPVEDFEERHRADLERLSHNRVSFQLLEVGDFRFLRKYLCITDVCGIYWYYFENSGK